MEYYRQFPTAILHLGVRSIALLTLSPLVSCDTRSTCMF